VHVAQCESRAVKSTDIGDYNLPSQVIQLKVIQLQPPPTAMAKKRVTRKASQRENDLERERQMAREKEERRAALLRRQEAEMEALPAAASAASGMEVDSKARKTIKKGPRLGPKARPGASRHLGQLKSVKLPKVKLASELRRTIGKVKKRKPSAMLRKQAKKAEKRRQMEM